MKQLKIFKSKDKPLDVYTEAVLPSQLYCQEFEAELILSIAKDAGITTYVQTEHEGETIEEYLSHLPPIAHESAYNYFAPRWVIGENSLKREPNAFDLARIRVRNGKLLVGDLEFPLDDPTFDLIGAVKTVKLVDIQKAHNKKWSEMVRRNPKLKELLDGNFSE